MASRIEAKSGRAQQLVVFLHGYGADGNDLIELGQQWRAILPNAAFVAPHADERCAAAPTRRWLALSSRAPDDPRGAADRWHGVQTARPLVTGFSTSRPHARTRRIANAGAGRRSQGSMMALHLGLRRRNAPAAIIAYSGLLAVAEHLAEAEARNATGEPRYPARSRRPGPDDSGRRDVPDRDETSSSPRTPTSWHLFDGHRPRDRWRRAAAWRFVPR